jgi:hypothetical protein
VPPSIKIGLASAAGPPGGAQPTIAKSATQETRSLSYIIMRYLSGKIGVLSTPTFVAMEPDPAAEISWLVLLGRTPGIVCYIAFL